MLISVIILKPLISFNSSKSIGSFSVMTFNTSFFFSKGDYSTEYESIEHNTKAQSILNWIQDNKTDIICLQEFYNDDVSNLFNSIEQLKEEYEYSFVNNPRVLKSRKRGLIIFSRFPIIHKGTIFLDENRFNGAHFVDVKIKDDTIRIINVHLQSFQYSNKKTSSSLKVQHDIITKRTKQISKVIEFISKTQYPTILSGDLNENAYTFNFKRLMRLLHDAFENSGLKFGITYNKTPYFLPRIDHQLYTNHFSAHKYRIVKVKEAEHYPVLCEYTILSKSNEANAKDLF